jgi:hypothetical protein
MSDRVPDGGTGTGMHRTLRAPLHPSGITFGMLRSPRGLKISQLHPLMEEFPVGNRGLIAIPIRTPPRSDTTPSFRPEPTAIARNQQYNCLLLLL